MDGAPQRELRSELVAGPEPSAVPGRDWLHVANHTRHTVSIRVDGRPAGRLGPHAVAGFYVGRSTAAQRTLVATCTSGRWEAVMRSGTVTWHLHEGS